MVLAAVVGNPFGPQPGLHFTETPQREYDFVVVGGGTAGSLIAAQLARSNPKWEVLLLEMAPRPSKPSLGGQSTTSPSRTSTGATA
jgi:choline dehydrogenase-like flavoprotein